MQTCRKRVCAAASVPVSRAKARPLRLQPRGAAACCHLGLWPALCSFALPDHGCTLLGGLAEPEVLPRILLVQRAAALLALGHVARGTLVSVMFSWVLLPKALF